MSGEINRIHQDIRDIHSKIDNNHRSLHGKLDQMLTEARETNRIYTERLTRVETKLESHLTNDKDNRNKIWGLFVSLAPKIVPVVLTLGALIYAYSISSGG